MPSLFGSPPPPQRAPTYTIQDQGRNIAMNPGFDVRTITPGVHAGTMNGQSGRMEYYRPDDATLAANPGAAGAIKFWGDPRRGGSAPAQPVPSAKGTWGGEEKSPWGNRQVKYHYQQVPQNAPGQAPSGYATGNIQGFGGAPLGAPASMAVLAADQVAYLQRMALLGYQG